MFEDEEKPEKPTRHEVGMPIDTLSVDELQDRINLLDGEIARLREAIAARQKTKSEAESLFKF